MMYYENIQQAMGVDIAISTEMAQRILLWNKMYENEAPWIDPSMDVLSCELPSSVCSEMATAVTMEARISVDGDARAEYLDNEFAKVKKDLSDIVEYACAGGGLILKPYISGEHIAVDYIHSDNFFPVVFNSAKQVTAAIFPEFKHKGKWLYTKLEYQEYDERTHTYLIQNKAFKSRKAAVKINDIINLGQEVQLNEVSEWADLEPEVLLAGATCPLFSYFRIPVANNVDRYSPLGVSIYARAVKHIRDADQQYGATLWEYKAKEAAVQAGNDFFEKDREGHVIMPKGKGRLYRDMGDVTDKNGSPFFNVYSPDIRNESFFDGYNRMLQRVEFSSHLAYGTISDPTIVTKTATEVKTGKQRSYAMVKAIQNSLRDALLGLLDAMNAWTTIGHLAPEGTFELCTDFDDSVVVDKDAERKTDREDVAMGAMQLWEYRAKYYGESEEQAKKSIQQPAEVIE